MFVDRVRVQLRSGRGGAGSASFTKQGRRPRGKPAGGSGGRGGRVVVAADPSMSTLYAYRRRPHHAAGDGVHGAGGLRHGKQGVDLVLPVPPGTAVFDEDGRRLADLAAPGQQVEVLEGGRGGKGNAALVSPRNRAPAFCEQGEYGAEAWFTLEMKLWADAALIGYPNAGKSTLIARVSAARPKIADYPFTTLTPNLGVVTAGDREFVLADVPGLVEGAAQGKGLGHDFLRHCERARVLVVLLDPSPLQTDPPERQYEVLCRELAAHDPDLAERPRAAAVTKADLGIPDALPPALRRRMPGVSEISSVTGQGVDELMYKVAELAERAKAEEPPSGGYVLHRPARAGFTVSRAEDGWVVEGRAAERAVALNDLTIAEAAGLAARRLARLGVDEALHEAGAQEGDEVRIGDLVFEFAGSEDG